MTYLSRLRQRLDRGERSPLQPCFVEHDGTRAVVVNYGTHVVITEAGRRAMEENVRTGHLVRTGRDHYCWTWFGYLAHKPSKVRELVNPN